ncbi:hypothetical protein CEUSTIGMA_g9742.t1 [Chlamydomonas eustigma]|uniref:PIG-P domain-containing protein n=1 Tax=Chlamydomonas eustigma TaxID=1157962 RepID=A0A250XGY9_9CHLO|nr:hypothetical protein CEUSTIGMA_g9742.t1 [Chlamydomonas eustigma]|eukprot:GAX82313.1 hypothetical protein CEUSTIGMA_g9742.t1 [Chlamydomonas eustigma]
MSRDIPGSAEAYGFALCVLVSIGTVIIVLWAYVPDQFIKAVGVTYYPEKQWAIILPAWAICAVLFFIFFVYESINEASVKPFTSISTIKDSTFKSYVDLGVTSVVSSELPGGEKSTLPLVHISPYVSSRVMYGMRSVSEALKEERLWLQSVNYQ